VRNNYIERRKDLRKIAIALLLAVALVFVFAAPAFAIQEQSEYR